MKRRVLLCIIIVLIFVTTGCTNKDKKTITTDDVLQEYFSDVPLENLDFTVSKNERTDDNDLCNFAAYASISTSQYESIVEQLDLKMENKTKIESRNTVISMDSNSDVYTSYFLL